MVVWCLSMMDRRIGHVREEGRKEGRKEASTRIVCRLRCYDHDEGRFRLTYLHPGVLASRKKQNQFRSHIPPHLEIQ